MKRLNAKFNTFFLKKVFPILFFLIIGLVLYTFTLSHYPSGIVFVDLLKNNVIADWYLQALPIIMGITGIIIFRFFIFPLMDNVLYHNKKLQLKRSRQETEIDLAEISKIHYNSYINPPIVTLTLKQDSIFGKKIRFIPVTAFSFNPFKKHEDIQNLITRIEKGQ